MIAILSYGPMGGISYVRIEISFIEDHISRIRNILKRYRNVWCGSIVGFSIDYFTYPYTINCLQSSYKVIEDEQAIERQVGKKSIYRILHRGSTAAIQPFSGTA